MEPLAASPLPTIRAFDTETDEYIACPSSTPDPPPVNQPSNLPPVNDEGQVLFYRTPFSDLYPNHHNAYLSSRFNFLAETVAVISMRPPTFPDTFKGCTQMPAQTDVRYWSFNVGGSKNANAMACLADYQAKVSADNRIHVVLGRPHLLVIEKVRKMDYNFLPWGTHEEVILVYRNLLSQNFEYGAQIVPPLDLTQPDLKSQSAEHLVKEYGPCGLLYTTVEDFLKNYPRR